MPHPYRHSLSGRYLQARVTKVFPDGGLEAEPLQPANSVAVRIKVHHYHLPVDRRPPNVPYQPGETLSLFIYDDRRSQNDPSKAAYASVIWATPADNPWESEDALRVGEIVTGSVIGFPDERHAIVLLDGLLAHAWLNAREVPDARPYYCRDDDTPLANFLSLNDRIKARLETVDRENCRLDISILAAFRDWETACRRAAHEEATPPAGYERLHLPELAEHEEQIFLWQPTEGQLTNTPPLESSHVSENSTDSEPTTTGLPLWQNVRLLIIENDSAFARSLKAWVLSQGGKVWLCAGHNDLQRLLDNGKIDYLALTHVLCDFNLSSHNESIHCHAWVDRHLGRSSPAGNVHVAWMSAQPEGVRRARQTGTTAAGDARLSHYLAGLPLFVKPIFFHELHAWFITGQPPTQDDPADTKQQHAWHTDLPDAPVMERARATLARFCTAGKALAALWIDLPSDDLFENEHDDVRLDLHVRASHGTAQLPGDWHLELGQSLLRDVFVRREGAAQRVAISGPLRKVAPQGAEWVVAWPVTALGIPNSDSPPLEPSRPLQPDSPPQGMLVAYFARENFSSTAWEPGGRLGELAALTCRHLDDLGALFSLSHFAREQDLFASAGRQLAAVLHELRSLSGDLAPLATDTSPEPGSLILPTNRTRNALRKLLKVAKQGLFYVRKERPEQLGLAGMLQRMTADLLWLPIHRSGCSLHVRLPPKAMQVNIPLEPLEHALGNIIGNAVDWSQGRTYARVTVTVALRPELGSMPLCIRVSDQGLGVGRDAQRNLFTPRLTEKGRKGQGMGLYISRTLLRSIGGDLLFDSRENYRFFGATFEIRLPWCVGE